MKPAFSPSPRHFSPRHLMWLFLLMIGAPSLRTAQAAGANPQAVQKAVNSAEFRAAYAEDVAQKLLGRGATGGEIAQWAAPMQGDAKGWMGVVAAVAGSPAYFQKVGSSNPKFVAHLFQDLVGRAPDAGEEAPAALDFLKGGGSRGELAAVVADTDEFRASTVADFT